LCDIGSLCRFGRFFSVSAFCTHIGCDLPPRNGTICPPPSHSLRFLARVSFSLSSHSPSLDTIFGSSPTFASASVLVFSPPGLYDLFFWPGGPAPDIPSGHPSFASPSHPRASLRPSPARASFFLKWTCYAYSKSPRVRNGPPLTPFEVHDLGFQRRTSVGPGSLSFPSPFKWSCSRRGHPLTGALSFASIILPFQAPICPTLPGFFFRPPGSGSNFGYDPRCQDVSCSLSDFSWCDFVGGVCRLLCGL